MISHAYQGFREAGTFWVFYSISMSKKKMDTFLHFKVKHMRTSTHTELFVSKRKPKPLRITQSFFYMPQQRVFSYAVREADHDSVMLFYLVCTV